jgi:hypothetical protein
MKKLILIILFGTLFFLTTREVIYAGHSHTILKVRGTCPDSLSHKDPNTLTFEVKNEAGDPQTVERFAIGYLGNTKQGPLIAGPFFRQITPVVLGDDETQTITLEFPPVPKTYPSDTVVSPFATIFTGTKHLGSGGCLAPVDP